MSLGMAVEAVVVVVVVGIKVQELEQQSSLAVPPDHLHTSQAVW
jgi:hypothetical protein